MLHFILGGARSGKSSYAEELAVEFPSVLYLATSQIYDEEMRHRVHLHQKRRPATWTTLEKYSGFIAEDFQHHDVILIDCLTLMITGLFFEEKVDDFLPEDYQKLEETITKEVHDLLDLVKEKTVFLVANELGLGIVPEQPMSRAFRDIAGRLNQQVAKRADKVSFMVAGLPMEVK